MRIRTLAVAALTLALTGCVSFEYTKSGATTADRDRDERECDYDAQKATASILNGFEAGWTRGELRGKCMEIRGYTRTQVQKATK